VRIIKEEDVPQGMILWAALKHRNEGLRGKTECGGRVVVSWNRVEKNVKEKDSLEAETKVVRWGERMKETWTRGGDETSYKATGLTLCLSTPWQFKGNSKKV